MAPGERQKQIYVKNAYSIFYKTSKESHAALAT